MTSPTEAELRKTVVQTARAMAAVGLVTGTSGNVSGRLDDRRMLVTPSGVDYATMGAADVVLVDLDGAGATGGLVPSSDTPNHVALYAARPDVRGIVHTHSPYATAFAIVGLAIPPVHGESAGYLGGAVPVLDLPLTGRDVAPRLARGMGTGRAALLPNHGVYAVGPTVYGAFTAARQVEDAARFAWLARALGTPREIGPEEIDVLRAFIHERYGQPGES